MKNVPKEALGKAAASAMVSKQLRDEGAAMSMPDLPTLRALRSGYARLAVELPEFLPVFERIDQDCADAEIFASIDPVAIARRHLEKAREAQRAPIEA